MKVNPIVYYLVKVFGYLKSLCRDDFKGIKTYRKAAKSKIGNVKALHKIL